MHSLSLITAAGSTLSVQAAGSGPAIILLHGFPLNHQMWIPLQELLAPDYHCIAIDFRGFGGSTLDGDYSIADLARDVETIRAHLAPEEQVHVVGLSMGGYVALEYWRHYAQHVRSLVLSNTKPEADDVVGKTARRQMAQKALEQDVSTVLEPMLARLIAPQAMNTAIEERVREMMQAAGAASVAAAQHAMADRRDFSQLIQSCKLPTLVITGQLDPIAPPESTRQWANRMPDANFFEIANCGHLAPLEHANEFREILQAFLSSN